MKWIEKQVKSNWSNNISYFASLTIADILILCLAVILIIWLVSHYWLNIGNPASYAIITFSDKPSLRVSLDHYRKLHLMGRLGESVLIVEQGKIRFIASPCNGKQCIHSGWLTQGGDFSACLPNQISVAVHSEHDKPFDAIAY